VEMLAAQNVTYKIMQVGWSVVFSDTQSAHLLWTVCSALVDEQSGITSPGTAGAND